MRSIRCRNGNISFYYREDSFITMTVLDIGYMQFRARHNLYAVRVDVSPVTLVTDIVAAMDPLLDSLAVTLPFDQVIFATEVPNPDGLDRQDRELSCFPKYVVLIALETTSDLLMDGLADAEIFGVNCNPMRIGPRYPQPQVRLLGYPPVPVGRRIESPDDLVMNLMENPNLCTEMVIQVLYESMFPEEPNPEWE